MDEIYRQDIRKVLLFRSAPLNIFQRAVKEIKETFPKASIEVVGQTKVKYSLIRLLKGESDVKIAYWYAHNFFRLYKMLNLLFEVRMKYDGVALVYNDSLGAGYSNLKFFGLLSKAPYIITYNIYNGLEIHKASWKFLFLRKAIILQKIVEEEVDYWKKTSEEIRDEWDDANTSKCLVSVILPTKTHEKNMRRCLSGIFNQEVDFQYEVIVIDSGSEKKALNVVKEFPVRLYTIPPEEFSHGRTRMYGVSLAQGDFVVFTVDDAIPIDQYWLKRLVDEIREDKNIAGVYGKQVIPLRENFNPVEILKDYRSISKEKVVNSYSFEEFNKFSPEEKRKVANFDDCTSCIRKSTLLQIPFERINYAEDITWAMKVLKKGFKTVYHPAAKIFHYHHQSFKYAFKRAFVDQRITKEHFNLVYVPNIMSLIRTGSRETMQVITLILAIKDLTIRKKIYWLIYNVKIIIAKNLGFYLGKIKSNKIKFEYSRAGSGGI